MLVKADDFMGICKRLIAVVTLAILGLGLTTTQSMKQGVINKNMVIN